jgi:hypothetical protein
MLGAPSLPFCSLLLNALMAPKLSFSLLAQLPLLHPLYNDVMLSVLSLPIGLRRYSRSAPLIGPVGSSANRLKSLAVMLLSLPLLLLLLRLPPGPRRRREREEGEGDPAHAVHGCRSQVRSFPHHNSHHISHHPFIDPVLTITHVNHHSSPPQHTAQPPITSVSRTAISTNVQQPSHLESLDPPDGPQGLSASSSAPSSLGHSSLTKASA